MKIDNLYFFIQSHVLLFLHVTWNSSWQNDVISGRVDRLAI